MPRTKELPVGVDMDMLEVKSGGRDFTFDAVGFSWTFKVQSVTWKQQWEAIEDFWRQVNGVADFDITGYYHSLLMIAIIAKPNGDAPTDEWLSNIEPEIFKILSTLVPSPVLSTEAAKIKKE